MPRRFPRRYYRNRDKYSIEQTSFLSSSVANWQGIQAIPGETQASLQWECLIVPADDTQGMRKVKHLSIKLCNAGNDAMPLWYALVYVPQGYVTQNLRLSEVGSSTYLYPANQFVMASGVVDFSAGPTFIRCPLSRNLNSGDRIVLMMATYTTAPSANQIAGEVTYAVTLQ